MSSTHALLLFFLITGLTVGFGHCIGMCGPIVVSLSLSLKGKKTSLPHLLYHGGRISTYVVLGGLVGLTGSFTGLAANIAYLQRGVMIFTGTLIIVLGLSMGGWISLGQLFRKDYAPKGIINRGFQRLAFTKSSLLYYPLGLLLGLLPCGAVYSSLVAVARAGMEAKNPQEGLLLGVGLMLAFGVGTVPALLIPARLSGLRWLRSREMIYKMGSVLMVILGAYFVMKGLRY